MKSIYELQKEANRLRQVNQVDSISPEEAFGLHSDTLAYIADLEQNADGLGIRKIYKNVDAMNADSTAPLGINDKPLRFGQLVVIYDEDYLAQKENGNIYAYKKGTEKNSWLLVGRIENIEELSKAVYEDLAKKADKEVMSTELAKKFDKTSVLQELGDSTDMVPSQKVVTDNLTELQNAVFPLDVSLSLDKTLLEYTGSEQSIKSTYSIKRKGSPITPTALILSVDGSVVPIDVKQADTVTIHVTKEGESQIILTAKHGELVKSASSKVTMVLPVYYGFGTTETDIAIADNKLSPRLSADGIYAKTSQKDEVRFIILAPKTLPQLTNFTMGGAPFVMETSTVSINDKDYYMYKSGALYMNGATLNVQAN